MGEGRQNLARTSSNPSEERRGVAMAVARRTGNGEWPSKLILPD
jgi:hypothetical protein